LVEEQDLAPVLVQVLYAAEVQERLQRLGPDAGLLHARAGVWGEERVDHEPPVRLRLTTPLSGGQTSNSSTAGRAATVSSAGSASSPIPCRSPTTLSKPSCMRVSCASRFFQMRAIAAFSASSSARIVTKPS